MAFNPDGAAQVSLTVFGGLVTEQSSVDLPEGVSPACADVEFVPGSVYSRRCFQKVLATTLGNVTIMWAKSFVTPAGISYDLILDSSGNLWYNNISVPSNPAILCVVQAGSYAKSITAFGREYIAIHNLLNGADVPLQWDGTYLDRVTQDGPGAAPSIANLAYPSVAMAASGSAPTLTITEIFPDQKVGNYWTALNIYTTTSSASVAVGQSVTVSGNATYNGTYTVIANPGPGGTLTVSALFPTTDGPVTSGTLTIGSSGTTLARAGNIVTVNTTSAHNLQVGNQAQISGPVSGGSQSTMPPLAVGGGISQIVIDNENNPGIALITTSAAHGLVPTNEVIINSVSAVAVGTQIASISWAGGITTVVMTAQHNLSPGALVQIDITNSGSGGGTAQTAFNSQVTVLSVPNSTTFTYAMTPLSAPAAYTGQAGDVVKLNWPIEDSNTPVYYEVQACPTPTTFQVAIEYSDGTWTTGQVGFPWEGTFFVASVPSSTSFTYQQYGPPGTSNTTGQVTPFGQIAPGQHQFVVMFVTRQGQTTRPSPPVTFYANGGQYVSVTNIPIGPPNVVARILAFTGSGGDSFFYIPVPPQANAQVVGTATQIYDNVTTSVVLDFSDNTLFAASGIDIPGNDVFNQIVIDGALGFGYYSSRLVTWGQRNRVQNFLNMGFEGGQIANNSGAPAMTLPCGWSVSPASGSTATLVPGYLTGLALNPGNATLTQSAYEDAYGAPIIQPNTPYLFRALVQGTGFVTASLSSASTGFVIAAALSSVGTGAQYIQAPFSGNTPTSIPKDFVLSINADEDVTLIDEMSVIYAQKPYTDDVMFMSYVDNPEAFDGVTGKIGSTQDSHKIMDISGIRQTGYFLTRDPGGRIHEFQDNGTTEPAGWTVNEVASNCGLLSAMALTKSQADDSSSSGGEEWFAWAAAAGAFIFGGGTPHKLSKEIQPNWDSISTATPLFGAYTNAPAYLTSWALNDPDQKELYFGLPIPTGQSEITNPNQIYVMNYRELDTAEEIAAAGPIRIAFNGRELATEHSRKWCPWNATMNGGALMFQIPLSNPSGIGTPSLAPTFFCGNGAPPGFGNGHGNLYTLSAAKFTDDDYGLISPYYTTYFLVSHDQEQQLSWQGPDGQRRPLGAGRKLLTYLTAWITAPPSQTNTQSLINISFYANTMANGAWPLSITRALAREPQNDLECAAGSVKGYRIAIQFASAPANSSVSLDNGFQLSHLSAWIKGDVHLPVRGAV